MTFLFLTTLQNMNRLKRTLVMLIFLVSIEYAVSKHITNWCNNRIQEISWAGTKSIISYDETNAIVFNKPVKNVNMSLWCESNTVINRCILEHITSEGKITKPCEYETSLSCSYMYAFDIICKERIIH